MAFYLTGFTRKKSRTYQMKPHPLVIRIFVFNINTFIRTFSYIIQASVSVGDQTTVYQSMVVVQRDIIARPILGSLPARAVVAGKELRVNLINLYYIFNNKLIYSWRHWWTI